VAATTRGTQMTDEEAGPGFRYWAFISYSHADSATAAWLHRALETYRMPRPLIGMPIPAGSVPARLSPIFRDRDELPTASDLGHTIEEALRQSWCLVVICSPAAAKSRWVDAEVEAFRRLGRSERIHCLIVAGEPDSTEVPCFPPALAGALRAQGQPAGEPIAADLRPHGDGRANARLKLVAGILGLRFDKFLRREQQRRHRLMLLVTLVSVLAAVVLATFSVMTISSRREADAQRRHAEGLVEFMLGDLRRKLEPDGKLATLDAVGKEALAYYAAQNPGQLDADALARRARALQQIGEVLNLRGQLDDALDVFRQAAATTAELLEREPDNGQRVFDHAQSVYWVGNVAYLRGDAATAEASFREYKTLAGRLVAMDPTNDDWQTELGYANVNLGVLQYGQGRADEARRVFEDELRLARQSMERAPGDYRRKWRIAQAHAWLADTSVLEGHLHDAVAHRGNEIAIYDDALTLDPTNNDAREALSVGERALAHVLLGLGRSNDARRHIQRAQALVTELIRTDPDNLRWLEHAAATSTTKAEMHARNGELAASIEEARRAQDLAARLIERDPKILIWQIRWVESVLIHARALIMRNDFNEARRVAQGVMSRLENLPASRLHAPRRAFLMAQAQLIIAEADRRQGNVAGNRNALSKVLVLLEGDIAFDRARVDAARAIALYRLGREAEARPFVDKLSTLDFHDPELDAITSEIRNDPSLDSPTLRPAH